MREPPHCRNRKSPSRYLGSNQMKAQRWNVWEANDYRLHTAPQEKDYLIKDTFVWLDIYIHNKNTIVWQYSNKTHDTSSIRASCLLLLVLQCWCSTVTRMLYYTIRKRNMRLEMRKWYLLKMNIKATTTAFVVRLCKKTKLWFKYGIRAHIFSIQYLMYLKIKCSK